MVCKFVVTFYRRLIRPVFVSGNNGNIIYWSAIFSFWSYVAWYFARSFRMKDPKYMPDYMREDAAITSPIWIVWVLCTVAMVSSEVISNLLLIKNNKIEAIRQVTMFVLYALYVGLSTAMVILFYPKYIPASVSFMAPKFFGFLFCLAFCLATTVTASMSNFTYIHYILCETKQVEQLRQRNYIFMASFSYFLRILWFVIFATHIYWIFLSSAFIDVYISYMFAVFVLGALDQCNQNNIKSLFGKEIRWPSIIVWLLCISQFYSVLIVLIVVFGNPPHVWKDTFCEVAFAALRPNGYEPVFCWIFFSSVVRHDTVQLRINDECEKLRISNVNSPSTLKRMDTRTKLFASLLPLSYFFSIILLQRCLHLKFQGKV